MMKPPVYFEVEYQISMIGICDSRHTKDWDNYGKLKISFTREKEM